MPRTSGSGDEGLRNAYERFIAGDPSAMAEVLAENVVYHLPGGHLGGGRLDGRAALVARLVASARWCDAPPEIELLEASGAGDFAVTVERFRARRGPLRLDQSVCVVWRMQGGRCVEIWSHFADQAACDRFWQGFA